MIPVSEQREAPASQPAAGPIRSVWFGTRCDFTGQALAGVLEPGSTVQPTAVVLPRSPKPMSAGWPAAPFDRWLYEQDIAVVEIDRLGGSGLQRVLEMIDDRQLALGVGACFPMKVPRAVREALPAGVLNIHPSLLPALRGPDPVFHAYRMGLAETGVTVHEMNGGWDSGPIVAQQRVSIPDEGTAARFEADLALAGGRMVASLGRRWCDGELHATPQDDTAATWAPAPATDSAFGPDDLTVEQAIRFVTACGPVHVRDADSGEVVAVSEVFRADGGLRLSRSAVRFRCRDGEVWFRRESLP